jgi:uncharacterized protein YkwD
MRLTLQIVSLLAIGASIIAALYLSTFRASSKVSTPLKPIPVETCFRESITAPELLTLTNRERTKAGLPALIENLLLTTAAQNKAQDMITAHYWSHISPTGIQPWYWLKQAGYPYTWAGENLAEEYSTSERTLTAWMNSPGHRANLLNPHYTEAGGAVVCGVTDKDTTLVVVEYGSRAR